jgi:putative flippase GtrA
MSAIIANQQERKRFLRFMTVGVIGAVVDFGVMNLLTHLFDTTLTLAGSISFICAVTSNFFWNRYWTYPDSRSKPLARQLLMFFIVNLAGVIIRIPILHFGEPPVEGFLTRFNISFSSPDFLAKNITLAVAVGIVMLWNFFVNRYWTYNDIDKVNS